MDQAEALLKQLKEKDKVNELLRKRMKALGIDNQLVKVEDLTVPGDGGGDGTFLQRVERVLGDIKTRQSGQSERLVELDKEYEEASVYWSTRKSVVETPGTVKIDDTQVARSTQPEPDRDPPKTVKPTSLPSEQPQNKQVEYTPNMQVNRDAPEVVDPIPAVQKIEATKDLVPTVTKTEATKDHVPTVPKLQVAPEDNQTPETLAEQPTALVKDKILQLEQLPKIEVPVKSETIQQPVSPATKKAEPFKSVQVPEQIKQVQVNAEQPKQEVIERPQLEINVEPSQGVKALANKLQQSVFVVQEPKSTINMPIKSKFKNQSLKSLSMNDIHAEEEPIDIFSDEFQSGSPTKSSFIISSPKKELESPFKPIPSIRVYKALYDSQSSQSDELVFAQDDYIVTISTDDTVPEDMKEQWIFGHVGDRRGLVPKSYVELMVNCDASPRHKVLYNYKDELVLAEGDIVVKVEDYDESWCTVVVVEGTSSGSTGYVPLSYIAPEFEDPFEEVVEETQHLAVQHNRTRSKTNPDVYLDASQLTDMSKSTWSSTVPKDILLSVSDEERKRQEAIFELIVTENTFIRNLQVVIEVFMLPLKSGNLLSASEVQSIFSNIETVFKCNVQILQDFLQVQRLQPKVHSIGDVVLKYTSAIMNMQDKDYLKQHPNEPSLLCYMIYCPNQMLASSVLQKKRQESTQLRDWLKKVAQTDPRAKSLDLSTFLLEPMQRITRYPLLLKQILHYTTKNHPDFDHLVKALQQCESLLNAVNQAIRLDDNRVLMEQTVSKIDVSTLQHLGIKLDLLSHTRNSGPRQLIYSGQLMKAKSNRKLECFLFSDLLLLCEPASGGTYTAYRQPFPLMKLTVRDVNTAQYDVSGDPACCFQIICGEEVVVVKAKDLKSRSTWVKQISAVVQDCLKSSSNLYKSTTVIVDQIIGTLNLLVSELQDFVVEAPYNKGEIYCQASIGRQVQKSKVTAIQKSGKHRQIQGRFNQHLLFSVNSIDEVLQLRLFHYQRFGQDEELSYAEIALDFLEYYCGKQTELIQLPLKDSPGKISIKLQYRPI